MANATKVALVTGAQQGIGRAMAVCFAQAGFDVAINYLDDVEAAESVAAAVRAAGRRAVLLRASVGDVAQCRALVARTVADLQRIDVLINNAGVFPRVPFLEMEQADWDHVLEINLRGSAFCAQAAAKAMIAGGHGGAIINIASAAAVRSSPRGAHYVASKGGVISLTRALALELAPYAIRVNGIAPGLTDTAQPRYGSSEAEIADNARAIPLGRIGQPDDIAQAALFLATDGAGFVTGQTLHVNGGSYLA